MPGGGPIGSGSARERKNSFLEAHSEAPADVDKPPMFRTRTYSTTL